MRTNSIKTQVELHEWSAKKIAEGKAKEAAEAAKNNLQPTASQSDSLFFTGKPYIADLESYAFRFRTYDPELHRWTSEDPSGFPDGPNGSAYMSVPTFSLDWQGLKDFAVVYLHDHESAEKNDKDFSSLQARESQLRQESGMVESDTVQFVSMPVADDLMTLAKVDGTSFDEIHVVTHGNFNDTETRQVVNMVSNGEVRQVYFPAEFLKNFNDAIKDIYSCNAEDGLLISSAIISQIGASIKLGNNQHNE